MNKIKIGLFKIGSIKLINENMLLCKQPILYCLLFLNYFILFTNLFYPLENWMLCIFNYRRSSRFPYR